MSSSLALAQGRRLFFAATSAASAARAGAASARGISTSDPNAKGNTSKKARRQAASATGSASASASASSAAGSSSSQPPPPPPSESESQLNSNSNSNPAAESTPTDAAGAGAGAAAPPATLLPSLDFHAAIPEPSPSDRPTGARSSKESLSTIERRRRFLGRVGLTILGVGLVGAGVYMGREWDEDEDVPQVCLVCLLDNTTNGRAHIHIHMQEEVGNDKANWDDLV